MTNEKSNTFLGIAFFIFLPTVCRLSWDTGSPSNVDGCTLNIKLQRITLAGYDFTLSEKNFTDNHLNLSAADKVNGDANRNHYLLITKGAGCGDVWIKGFYGFEHDEPDADW
ncbi:hypothetical protein P5660_15315 [Bacillus velezensis]|uniref:hypothetical protein n=1 Tax=Bacillus velezensis TaxID=492670 RepID=UPI00279DAD26|nr:hypothetical protein P5660_15315 [Bacillus velezensis]